MSSPELVEVISETNLVEIFGGEPELVEIESPGPQGARGPQGEPGPPGPPGSGGSGSGGSYVHGQSISSDVWHVVHNLGFYPNVTVTDSGGTEVEGQTVYIDGNTLDILFAVPFGGTAYLS